MSGRRVRVKTGQSFEGEVEAFLLRSCSICMYKFTHSKNVCGVGSVTQSCYGIRPGVRALSSSS